jgi:hypothetical protein
MRIDPRWAGAVVAAVAIGWSAPGTVWAEDRDADPEMATSGDPDEQRARSLGPDSSLAESEDSDDRTEQAEDSDDRLVGSEDSDDRLGRSRDVDTEPGRSEDLGDLPNAAPAPAPAPPDGSAQRATTIAPSRSGGEGEAGESAGNWEGRLAQARARLDRAQRDLERWTEAYTRAINTGYPRGDARARIVTERDRAQTALDAAREELADTAESARRAGVNPMIIEGFTGSM